MQTIWTWLKKVAEQYPDGVQFTATPTDHNPNLPEWGEASHYRCTLSCGATRMRVYFSLGAAYTRPPTLDDILNCLADDAATYENAQSFPEWCDELGYDSDSRKAEATYRTIGRQAASLKEMLGPVAYEQLVWHTERF